MSFEAFIFLAGLFVTTLFAFFIAFTIYEVRRYNPHAFKREMEVDSPIVELPRTVELAEVHESAQALARKSE